MRRVRRRSTTQRPKSNAARPDPSRSRATCVGELEPRPAFCEVALAEALPGDEQREMRPFADHGRSELLDDRLGEPVVAAAVDLHPELRRRARSAITASFAARACRSASSWSPESARQRAARR